MRSERDSWLGTTRNSSFFFIFLLHPLGCPLLLLLLLLRIVVVHLRIVSSEVGHVAKFARARLAPVHALHVIKVEMIQEMGSGVLDHITAGTLPLAHAQGSVVGVVVAH